MRESAAVLCGVMSVLAAGAAAWSLWGMYQLPDRGTVIALLVSAVASFLSAVLWRWGASRSDATSLVRRCAFWGFVVLTILTCLINSLFVGAFPDVRLWLQATVAIAAPVFSCVAASKRVTLLWFGVSLTTFGVLLWTAVLILHDLNWLRPG